MDSVDSRGRNLPLYCYDSDADFPPPARALKEAVARVDAILFVTPEYNRSIPGGLHGVAKRRCAVARRKWQTRHGMPDIMEGRIEPGRVLDRVTTIEGVPDGYRAMNDREAIKVMITF